MRTNLWVCPGFDTLSKHAQIFSRKGNHLCTHSQAHTGSIGALHSAPVSSAFGIWWGSVSCVRRAGRPNAKWESHGWWRGCWSCSPRSSILEDLLIVVLYMGIFLGPRHMVRLYPVMCSIVPYGKCSFVCYAGLCINLFVILFVWENKPQIPRSFMYSSILVIKLTFFFWLKYSWFTMLLQFLLYSKKVAKSYIYVYYFFFPNCLPSCFNPRETHILDLELAFIKPIIITLCTYMPGHCQGRWS